MAGVLVVATCQFPVSANVVRNGGYVMRQMRVARERGALVAHFPEACLSGYAGSDCESYEGFNWDVLERVTRKVLDLACELWPLGRRRVGAPPDRWAQATQQCLRR